MPLLNGDNFLHNLQLFRIAWFTGQTGASKSAISTYLDYDFLRRGIVRYCITNKKCVFRDRKQDIVLRDGRYLDAVIDLDEGGLYLDDYKRSKSLMAGLRMMNCIVFLPSVMSPSSRLRFMKVQRVQSWLSFGVPLWQFKSSIDLGAIRDVDKFSFLNPSEIFGLYDSTRPPAGDASILQFLTSILNDIRYRLRDDEEDSYGDHEVSGDEDGEDVTPVASALDQAAGTLSDAASSMVQVFRSGSRKRR
jgi:hypothetical protein